MKDEVRYEIGVTARGKYGFSSVHVMVGGTSSFDPSEEDRDAVLDELQKWAEERLATKIDSQAGGDDPRHSAKKPRAKMAGRERTPYFCGECGRPQYRTPSGLVCAKGHGGAPSTDADGRLVGETE